MATCAVSFESFLTVSSAGTDGTCTLNFNPPSNISGKLCYAKVEAFNLNWDDGSVASSNIYTNPKAYHNFVLRADWAQTQSASVEGVNTQRLSVPLAILKYATGDSVGLPTLIFIPDGPHSVRFDVTRADLGAIATANSQLDFIVRMTIVAANSRQPPIV